MGRSEPEREHAEFLAMTQSLTTTLQNGRFGDRVVAEHLLRVLGATAQILAEHTVDGMGRCCACRRLHRISWRPRNRRTICVVHDTFSYFLKGRRRFPKFGQR